jgi:hypothetical protein
LLLSWDISVSCTGIDVIVDGTFVGITGSAVDGDEVSTDVIEVASGDVDMGTCEQAIMKKAARVSTAIRL